MRIVSCIISFCRRFFNSRQLFWFSRRCSCCIHCIFFRWNWIRLRIEVFIVSHSSFNGFDPVDRSSCGNFSSGSHSYDDCVSYIFDTISIYFKIKFVIQVSGMKIISTEYLSKSPDVSQPSYGFITDPRFKGWFSIGTYLTIDNEMFTYTNFN